MQETHLARDAWIEISSSPASTARNDLTHLARDAWIEIRLCETVTKMLKMTHLARDAWIEILQPKVELAVRQDASRKRCVD